MDSLNLTSFIFQASVCSSLFFMFYYLFLRRDTFFHRNRWYLNMALVLSFVLPALSFNGPSWIGESYRQVQVLEPYWVTGEVAASENVGHTPLANNMAFVLWAYFSGLLIAFCLFIQKIIPIWLMVRKGEKFKNNGFTLVKTTGGFKPFSFFQYVFWDNELCIQGTKQQVILAHELAHVNGRHSADIILAEIAAIFLWFNPVSYWYINALKEQHEYIADAHAVALAPKGNTHREDKVKYYQKLLAEMFVENLRTGFIHGFCHCSLKKRLTMIAQSKTPKYFHFKNIFVLPIVAVLLLFASCNLSEGQIDEYGNFQIDQNAEPNEGYAQFYKYIQRNISIPKEARAVAKQGEVAVKFTIEKDGSVTDIGALTNLGSGLEEEVVGMIENSPITWKAASYQGKSVPQEIVLPVQFKLEGVVTENIESGYQPPEKSKLMGKVTVIGYLPKN